MPCDGDPLWRGWCRASVEPHRRVVFGAFVASANVRAERERDRERGERREAPSQVQRVEMLRADPAVTVGLNPI